MSPIENEIDPHDVFDLILDDKVNQIRLLMDAMYPLIKLRESLRWQLFQAQYNHQLFCDQSYMIDPRCQIFTSGTEDHWKGNAVGLESVRASLWNKMSANTICVCQSFTNQVEINGQAVRFEIDSSQNAPAMAFFSEQLTQVEQKIAEVKRTMDQLFSEFVQKSLSLSRLSFKRQRVKGLLTPTIAFLKRQVISCIESAQIYLNDFKRTNSSDLYWLYMKEIEFQELYESQLRTLEFVRERI